MEQRVIGVAIAALLLALTACSGSKQPGVSDNDPAGEVVELAGAVHAERAGAKRLLSAGEKVFGKDVVSTSDGASVAIRLFHNNAVWRIEGGISRELKRTAAWRAKKTTSGSVLAGGGQADETAAAGRHGERSAVQTRATARAPEPATEETSLRVAPPAAPGGAAPTSATEGPATGGLTEMAPPAKRARETVRDRAPKRRNRMRKRAPTGMRSRKPKPSLREEMSKLPPPAPMPTIPTPSGLGGVSVGGPPGTRGSGGTVGKGGGGSIGSIGSGAGRGKSTRASRLRGHVAVPAPRVRGALSAAIVRRVLRGRYVPALRACYEKALKRKPTIKGALDVSFSIALNGRVSAVRIAGAIADTSMRGCVARRLRTARFPTSKKGGVTNVVQRLVFSIR